MPDLDSFLDFLENATPLAGFIGALIVLAFAFFKHRETMRQLRGFSDVRSEIGDLKVMLTAHVKVSETRADSDKAQVECLREIHKELIKLNSIQEDGFVTTSDAKLMIAYQWSWCRDETARLICNSVSNNNFRKNEELIARKVQRAWKKAAENSRQSLLNLKSLKYPFDVLYERHICMIWEYCWKWAIPLYHRDLGAVSLEEALSDLRDRILCLFDDTLEAYFESIEDIDSGQLYKPEEVRGSGEFRYSDDDITPTAKMANDLKKYKKGSATESSDGESDRVDVRDEMKKRTSSIEKKADGGPALEPNS